ncbi:PLP-dependent cysteine synthase family protein [Streptomyces zaomyceticus]|uniref:PLP-dependent cysteine synthase family protein n=1 Tax=Streptomyces zaomyceticus TaxID=68286 RepID=UPI00324B3399
MIQPLQAELSAGPFPLPDFPALHRAHPRLVPFARQLGGTSLREVPGPPGGARILAKCEGENPVGSVKDRVAYALICSALEGHGDRDLSELRLLEYSGGNLARALAHLGALLGIHMKFVVPSVTPPSLLDTLTGYGFEYALVDKELGFLGVIEETLALAAAQPEWTLLYQHRNEVNPAFHAATTGAELLDQLDGVRPAAWVASIGSGGTLTGVRSRLLEVAPGLRTVGVTPAELPYGSPLPPNGLPKYTGATGLGNGLHQPFVRRHGDAIEHRTVARDEALDGMVELHALSGLRAGSSGAANWLVARAVAAELPSDAVVLTVFPDAGSPEDWDLARSRRA